MEKTVRFGCRRLAAEISRSIGLKAEQFWDEIFRMITDDFHHPSWDLPSADISTQMKDRTFFTTLAYDATIGDTLSLNFSLQHFKHRLDQINETLGLYGPGGQLFYEAVYDEETTSASGKLVYDYAVDADIGLAAASFTASMSSPKASRPCSSNCSLILCLLVTRRRPSRKRSQFTVVKLIS